MFELYVQYIYVYYNTYLYINVFVLFWNGFLLLFIIVIAVACSSFYSLVKRLCRIIMWTYKITVYSTISSDPWKLQLDDNMYMYNAWCVHCAYNMCSTIIWASLSFTSFKYSNQLSRSLFISIFICFLNFLSSLLY